MKIYTLTLSPAFDLHASAQKIEVSHENLARVLTREAGGKGVNISRSLSVAGVENIAVVVLGRENGQNFKNLLQGSGLRCLYIEKEGRIRENLTIHTADGRETRISFTGFSVNRGMLEEISKAIPVDTDAVVTFTGRVPDGIDMESVRVFLLTLKARGAKLVLDSRSLSAEDICLLQPWLIKPNQEEVSQYFGCEISTFQQAEEKARIFLDHGVENTMVSLGEQGALLLTKDAVLTAVPPQIQAISTIGAGDSAIAGFLAAAAVGGNEEECLRSAVAFGTAACLTDGSQPPQKDRIDEIINKITVIRSESVGG